MFEHTKLESLRDVNVTRISDTLSQGFPHTVFSYCFGTCAIWNAVRVLPLSIKVNTSVDEDIECQPYYQIRKGSIQGLKNAKAK